MASKVGVRLPSAALSIVVTKDNGQIGVLPRQFFMGFGYNSDLIKTGERFEILDYFRWVKLISEKQEIGWLLWDASCYYIVNRIKQKKIPEELLARREAKVIMDILFEEMDRKKEIRENNNIRTQYLDAILKVTGINGKVIDAYGLIRDQDYLTAFSFCLDFCERQQRLEPERVPIPKNANRVNALYFPLETAEALFIQSKYGIDTKFGPNTEKNFDYFITKAANELGRSYSTIWCPVFPRMRTPYLRGDERSIFFTDNMDVVRNKLSNPLYRMWIEEIVEPLAPGMELEQAVEKIITNVKGELK